MIKKQELVLLLLKIAVVFFASSMGRGALVVRQLDSGRICSRKRKLQLMELTRTVPTIVHLPI